MRIYKEPSLDYLIWVALVTLLVGVVAVPLGVMLDRDIDIRFQQAAESNSVYQPTQADSGKMLTAPKPRLIVVNGKARMCGLTDDDKLLCVGGKD